MSDPTVRGIEQQLRTLMASFDAGLLSTADAGEMRRHFTAIKRLAEAGELATAKRVADTAAVRTRKDPNGHRWAGRQLGVSEGQAAAKLELAERLERLPSVKEAVHEGRISLEQAAEIARTACEVPDAESTLLEMAPRESLGELRRRGSRLRAGAPGAEGRLRALKNTRYLRTWTDPDGAGRGSWLVTPDVQAELLALLAPFREGTFRAAKAEGRRETAEAYDVDALLAMARAANGESARAPVPGAEAVVAEGSERGSVAGRGAAAGGPSVPSLDGATRAALVARASDGSWRSVGEVGQLDGDRSLPPGRSPQVQGRSRAGAVVEQAALVPVEHGSPANGSDPRLHPLRGKGGRTPVTAQMKVIVRVDAGALQRGEVAAGEVCEVVGVGPVTVEAVRRWMRDDAFVAVVLTEGDDVRSVVHLGRSPTALQRTVLEWEQHECQVLGCSAMARLQIDHTEEWSRTGHTTVGELDHLCPAHHRMKTHDGWRLEPGRGKRRFLSPAEQAAAGGGRDGPTTPHGSAGPVARPAVVGLSSVQDDRPTSTPDDEGPLSRPDDEGPLSRPDDDGPEEPPPSLFGRSLACRASVITARRRILDDTGPPKAA